MKTKLELLSTLVLCSIPGFAAGWLWPSGDAANNEKPVKQVIEAIESAGVSTDRGVNTEIQTAAIFDSLHNRTVTSFVNTFKNFGIGRITKIEDMRHTDLWTLHPGRNDGFEVSLIGLDREAPIRYDRHEPDTEPEQENAASDSVVNLLRLQEKLSPDKTVPLESLDVAGLTQLKDSGDSKRAIFSQHDSIVAYGPIRTAESCLRCHDGDIGDLLGVFRYDFPIPAHPLNLRLAGTP